MGDELQWLPREQHGCIFKSYDISLETYNPGFYLGLWVWRRGKLCKALSRRIWGLAPRKFWDFRSFKFLKDSSHKYLYPHNPAPFRLNPAITQTPISTLMEWVSNVSLIHCPETTNLFKVLTISVISIMPCQIVIGCSCGWKNTKENLTTTHTQQRLPTQQLG